MYINMSVNSSSFDDFPVPPHFSNSSLHPLLSKCFSSRMNTYVFYAFSITNLFLLPLLILVFYLGYQQWRKQRYIATAAASHSDLFTYHSIAMQLNEFLGLTFFFCGGYINLPQMKSVGLCVWCVTSIGQALFHLLTCVEHYLAVVYPITYLDLRQAGGVRIRNISIGCVWLLSFGWMALYYLSSNEFTLSLYFFSMVCFLIVISFCSISVLCTLKRPRPGEVGGNRERVDQSKQRAFHTIMAIMVVLLFRFGGNLLCTILYASSMLSNICVGLLSVFCFDPPSRFVLPLLFLHRAGKLQCCKQKSQSG